MDSLNLQIFSENIKRKKAKSGKILREFYEMAE